MSDRFRFGSHLGSGGFGSVERAERIDSDGNVVATRLAQKKLLPQWVNDTEALGRFRREVRILAEMDHPNILPVLGRNLSDNPPWFVMPEAESSLADEIQAGRQADEGWLIKTFAAVLKGMAYAHSQRRIHRDLKPENVLIVGGVPMISDFGLGKRLDANTISLTQTHAGMGTFPYMAPEQFRDAAHVGLSADVYALGKMLVELLTGVTPSVGRPRVDNLPEQYRSFVEKCTEEEPGDRYANSADALAAFQLLVSDGADALSGDAVEGLVKEWEATPLGADAELVERIATMLVASRTNEELLWNVVPRLPITLVEQLMESQGPEFDLILRAYNGHIQGGLPFEYCDVVANFYRRVYARASEPGHRQLILERLIQLGPSHNRWHVGDVVASLLGGITDASEAEIAATAIRDDPMHARWYEEYVRNRPLPTAVAKAFEALWPQPDDDIPV
jgi:serine/threonine protein kinase